ncbi:MAG: AbrB family transcriptional regulator [Bradyrhizobiaceae bacterium]|nr:AbrB family transcriptional regulator [Bradyrhizobiaceae bacterium]
MSLEVIERQKVNDEPVIPRAVRKQLALKPGDTLRYRIADDGVLIEKAGEMDDPFAAFSEWTEEADEKAYAGL